MIVQELNNNEVDVKPEHALRRQSDIEDIIGHPPSWILYWGIVVIGFFLLILYSLMAFVKYPDKLSAPIIMTTENPAIKVYSEIGGMVKLLFAKDQEEVLKDQNILLFESDLVWEDLILLKNWIAQFDEATYSTKPPMMENLYLGVLQTSYTELIQRLHEHDYLSANNQLSSNIEQIKNRILRLELLNRSTVKQNAIFESEVQLIKKKYDRYNDLLTRGAISSQEFETTEQEYLSSKRQLENRQAELIQNKIQVDELQASITALVQADSNKKFEINSSIDNLLRKLKNEITVWEKKHLLKAPIAGKLSMSKIWSENQSVSSTELICTVVPSEELSSVFIRAKMPVFGIGKVNVGTKANMRIHGFPEQEFGILRGYVQSVSMIPDSDDGREYYYLVELGLDNDLITTYQKEIPMHHEMSGTAEFITEDKSILQRVINQGHDIFKNQ